MELDFTTILYIIFGLLYFVFTGAAKKRKRQQNQGPSADPRDATETLGPPPVNRRPTFEELLQEFTGEKPNPQPVEEVEPEVVLPVEPEPIPEKVSIYQQRQAEIMARDSGETRREKIFERFDEFESEEVELSTYAELMREPDGAKKAFVLGEIFNKKY